MLDRYILRTPLIPYRGNTGPGNIFLKPENLQIFGSYKIRGVAAAISKAQSSVLSRGLVTVSAGNMAQAVAFAAQQLKVSCRIYVPNSAPEVKKTAIKNLGAEIIERRFDEIWHMVKCGDNNSHEGLLVHPVFTESLLQGYGTIAQEIIQDLDDLDAVVIPFGVGGLTLGISRVLKVLRPQVAIYTCEPTTAAPLQASLRAKHAMRIERQPSFIDAIGTPGVLTQVYEELKNVITESISITPEEAMKTLRELLNRHKLLSEIRN